MLKQIYILVFFISIAAFAKAKEPLSASSSQTVESRLRANGFPKPYINELLKFYDGSKRDQILRLNVLGFLLSPDYSGHVSPDAVKKCREFIKKNSKAFEKAEAQLGVKKEVIAALLWVESRFGENHGVYHVASVYLSLIQSEFPDAQSMLKVEIEKKHPHPTKKMLNLLKTRSESKSRWAVGELWALYRMNKKNPKTVTDLKGSYSGAFGYSQFLPSSYLVWAKSFDDKKMADLYAPEDAIMSVANYLRKNGFKLGKPKSYSKALFRYNHSDDYGNAILKLADQIAAAS